MSEQNNEVVLVVGSKIKDVVREHDLQSSGELVEAVSKKVREMLEEEDLLDEGGLRLSSLPGAGCSAPLQFGMELDVAPEPGDIVLEGQGIRIFMDPTSAWSLDGLKVDYVTNPHMGEGFAFQHPRGPSGRSC